MDFLPIYTLVNDQYEILGKLGEGGFSVVYRARQIKLDREIAIKMLLPWLADNESMIERFKHEAMLVKNLTHPNTVRVYDFGLFENTLFIAMELLEGDALENFLLQTEEGFSLERVWYMSHQILKSLSEAHSFGIIHRDLKPTNIFLCPIPGDMDFIKVMDFGISKTIADCRDNKRITEHGVVVGTPNYMAPEALSDDPCLASDIFSLGLLILEMLSGNMVNPSTNAIEAVEFALSEDPILIPDWIRQGRFGPILEKALQKDPELRYANATEMLLAYDKANDGLVRKTATFESVDHLISNHFEVEIRQHATPTKPISTAQIPTNDSDIDDGWDLLIIDDDDDLEKSERSVEITTEKLKPEPPDPIPQTPVEKEKSLAPPIPQTAVNKETEAPAPNAQKDKIGDPLRTQPIDMQAIKAAAASVIKHVPKQRAIPPAGPTVKLSVLPKTQTIPQVTPQKTPRAIPQRTPKTVPQTAPRTLTPNPLPVIHTKPVKQKVKLPLWLEFILVLLGATGLFIGAFFIFVEIFSN